METGKDMVLLGGDVLLQKIGVCVGAKESRWTRHCVHSDDRCHIFE